jgi:bifunctional non-homologous end joining protein LigD
MKKATSPDTPAAAKPKRTARPISEAAGLPDLSPYGRLAEYNRKRHFGVTPEPPGTARARAAGRPLEFVVQKHRATRLHYDFRLEHRGVMLSWAVPKGPSPDPSTKRLAMQTEPHPMEYNQFEGVIPEGQYGGGTVMIWDKGIWAPVVQDRFADAAEADRQLEKGDLKFVLLGEKLQGSWVLVRTRDTGQWLLIKHRDDYASREDLTVSQPRSVVSGRSMAEIARAAGASARQLEQAAGTDPATVPPAPPARRDLAPSRRGKRAPSRPRLASRRAAASRRAS